MTAPIGEPPHDMLPPDAPATVEDVRASRRWIVVALVWAIAASAIAVLALVQANDNGSSDNPPAQTTDNATQRELDALQKQTNDRLDAFSGRLDDTASDADVQKLDKRLATAEDDASEAKSDAAKQSDAITQLQTDLKDLQQRVDELEAQQQDQATTP